jgi:NhaA family Na+:H+ antiporter
MNVDSLKQRRLEAAAGILLIGAALLALFAANSSFAASYDRLLHWEIGPALPRHGILGFHEWVADGLMAVFFLLVGLEVKREWYEGRLATAEARRLPVIAAVAGMALPAGVYLTVAGFDGGLVRGWAIPAATDIAFVIGLLALLGSHAPAALRLLLVTIAIVDDIGAVAIIALAYTEGLDGTALAMAAGVTGIMAFLGLLGIRKLWPFMVGFVILWLLILASGVHATIAGVLAALTVPLATNEAHSPLKHLEHILHPWVVFGIVPLFGFVSAGVHLQADLSVLANPVTLAVLLGLVIGKQLGIFGAVYGSARLGLCSKPIGVSWPQLYGGALLCGVGFTMSLFIGALAFPGRPELIDAAKIGTLTGSLASAVLGCLILRLSSPTAVAAEDDAEYEKVFGREHHDE